MSGQGQEPSRWADAAGPQGAPAPAGQPPVPGSSPVPGPSPVQPYYAPPGAYVPPPAAPRQPTRWMAITALSIAIPAALLRFIPFIGGMFIVPVIVAIIFAIIALAVHQRGKGMSIAALIIGVVGLVVPIVFTVLRLGLLGISMFGFIQEST